MNFFIFLSKQDNQEIPRGIDVVRVEIVEGYVEVANDEPSDEQGHNCGEDGGCHFFEVDGDCLTFGDNSHCDYLPLIDWALLFPVIIV